MPFKPPILHDGPAATADARLEADVAAALNVAADIDAINVTVTATSGGIVLGGTMGLAAEAARAEEIARGIAGKVPVVNLIAAPERPDLPSSF